MILAHPKDNQQALLTTNPEVYDLALGQAWESLLAAALCAQGFRAYQPKQQFMDSSRAVKVSKLRLRGRHDLADRYAKEWHDRSLLRPLQLDVVARLGKRRFNLECKALTAVAFDYPYIHVGCCDKWDLKRIRVDGLVLVNQATREAWIVPADTALWMRRRAIVDSGYDYAVPRHLLTPLQAWVDAARDID